MTARAPALFCSVLSLQAGRGARVRAGVMRLNACSVPLSRRETTNGSPQGMGRGSHLRSRVSCVNDHVCAGSVPLSRRERGRGEGAHLRSRVLCVNDRSCLGLGEAPLFRAAAAARATFLAGKVAKAIHAAACAVLRTVPCAARRWLTLRTSKATARALDLQSPSAAAGLRGTSTKCERDDRAHAPQAMDGHRRAPRRHAQARAPAQRALLSGSAFFGSFLCRPKERNPRRGSGTEQGKLAKSKARAIVHALRAAVQPGRTRQPCSAQDKSHVHAGRAPAHGQTTGARAPIAAAQPRPAQGA